MDFFEAPESPAAWRDVVDPATPSVVEHDKLSLPTELDGDEEWVGAAHRSLHVVVLGVLQAVDAAAVLDERHTLNHVLQFGLNEENSSN